MKKFIAMLTLLIGFNANAGLLTIDLSADEVSVGESVLVTINAQGFDETDMFGFDLNFDNSLMAYVSSSLTSDLALIDTSMGMLDGLEVEEYDSSLAFGFSTYDLSLMAAGDFVLATFNLTADSAGFTDFSISDFFVFDEFGETAAYSVAFSGASSVNVSASSIPEPTSAALLMLAGLAFVSSRRKAK